MRELKTLFFKCGLTAFICAALSILLCVQAGAATTADELLSKLSGRYLKEQADFTSNFKVNSKIKDISFEGKFYFKPAMSFVVDAASAALKLKIVFTNGDGFIYLPAANIITNLDKLTQQKTKSIQFPSNVQELETKMSLFLSEFEVAKAEDGQFLKFTAKSKKARGSFCVLLDKASSDLKNITTYNNKGNEELIIEFSGYQKEKVADSLFVKPQNAVEANMPVPLF